MAERCTAAVSKSPARRRAKRARNGIAGEASRWRATGIPVSLQLNSPASATTWTSRGGVLKSVFDNGGGRNEKDHRRPGRAAARRGAGRGGAARRPGRQEE